MTFSFIAIFRATEYQQAATRISLVLFSPYCIIDSFLGMKLYFLGTLKRSWDSGKHIASHKHQCPFFYYQSQRQKKSSCGAWQGFFVCFGKGGVGWIFLLSCESWYSLQSHSEESNLAEVIYKSMKRKVSESHVSERRFNHLITAFMKVVNKLLFTSDPGFTSCCS